jgi:hypothetical protein
VLKVILRSIIIDCCVWVIEYIFIENYIIVLNL